MNGDGSVVVCSWTEEVQRWQADDSRCWRLFLSISNSTVPLPRELSFWEM